jgi:hypothetical protein
MVFDLTETCVCAREQSCLLFLRGEEYEKTEKPAVWGEEGHDQLHPGCSLMKKKGESRLTYKFQLNGIRFN